MLTVVLIVAVVALTALFWVQSRQTEPGLPLAWWIAVLVWPVVVGITFLVSVIRDGFQPGALVILAFMLVWGTVVFLIVRRLRA